MSTDVAPPVDRVAELAKEIKLRRLADQIKASRGVAPAAAGGSPRQPAAAEAEASGMPEFSGTGRPSRPQADATTPWVGGPGTQRYARQEAAWNAGRAPSADVQQPSPGPMDEGGMMDKVAKSVLSPAQDLASRRKVGADAIVGAGINTVGSALAAPFTAAQSQLPGGAKRVVEYPFKKFDEYVAQPLAWLAAGGQGGPSRLAPGEHGEVPMSESVRAGVNVAVPLLVAHGIAREAAARGVGAPKLAEVRARAAPLAQVAVRGAEDVAIPPPAPIADMRIASQPSRVRALPEVSSAERPGVIRTPDTEGTGAFESAKPVSATITDAAVNKHPWIGLDERLAKRGLTIHDAIDAAVNEDDATLSKLPDRDAHYLRLMANEFNGARRIADPAARKAALDEFFTKTVNAPATSEIAPTERHVFQADLAPKPGEFTAAERAHMEARGLDPTWHEADAMGHEPPAQTEPQPWESLVERPGRYRPRQPGTASPEPPRGSVPPGAPPVQPPAPPPGAALGARTPPGGARVAARGGFTPGWLDTSVESLKRADEFGPGGQRLGDDVHDVLAGKRAIRGEVGTPFDREFEKLSRSQRDAAQADLDRWKKDEAPTPPWARPLVEAARVAMREIANHENAAGVRIQENGLTADDLHARATSEWAVREGEKPGTFDVTRPVPNDNPRYVPGGGTPEYKAAILAENRPSWKGPKPLTDEWMATGDNASKENPFAPREGETEAQFRKRSLSQMESFFAGDERAHEYDWPRSAQIPNKVDLFRNRIDRGAQNASEQRVMQYRKPDPGGGWTVGKDEGNLIRHLDDIRDLAVRDDPRVTQQQAGAAAESAKSLALRNLGRNPADAYGPGTASKFVKGWNKWEAVYTTLSKLGLSVPHVFTRTGHALLLAARVGPKLATQAMYEAATHYGATREAGLVAGSIEPGMNEVLRSGVVDEPRTGGRAYNALQAVTRVATAPANAVSNFMSVAAHAAADAHLADVQASLAKGGRSAAWAERAMQTLDLSPGDMAAIRSGDVSPLLRSKFAQALVDKVSLRAQTADKPAVMTNPKWASMWRFKGVHAAATREFLDVSLREAAHGNMAPLVTIAVGSVALAMAKNQLMRSLGMVSSKDDEGLIAKAAQGDAAGVLKWVLAATAKQGATGNIAPLAESSWAGEGGKSKLYEEVLRSAIPPWMNSLGNLLRQFVISGDRKTVEDYMKQGRNAPQPSSREPASTTRGGARVRAARDFAAVEAPQVTRVVRALTGTTR